MQQTDRPFDQNLSPLFVASPFQIDNFKSKIMTILVSETQKNPHKRREKGEKRKQEREDKSKIDKKGRQMAR